MPRTPVPETIRAIALSDCIVEPELLNSKRIKQRFSSYGIDVLDSENGLRRASLHSVENGSKVCRTCAVVRFDSVPADIIGDEHQQILEGASIGETFKTNGWRIYKETRYVGELQVPAESSAVLELMALGADSRLAIHAYRLLLKKDLQTIDYATIVEAHHPDYLDRDDLTALYLVDAPALLTGDEIHDLSKLVLLPNQDKD